MALEATLTAIKGGGWTDETLVTLSTEHGWILGDTGEILNDTERLPLNPASEDTLTAMKGAGWSTETLKVIKDAIDALNNLSVAQVWAYGTRSLTDKAGFTISGTKTTLDALNDIAAGDVWAVAVRTLTSPAFGDLVTKNLIHILSDSVAFKGADIATILAETQSHPTLAEIEATTVLAKEATLTHATYGLDKIKAETALIKAKTDLIPADITTQLDTNVPAIKAKTDLIPASPATEGTSTAIKTKTDALPSDPADESAVEAAITAAHATTDGKVDTVDTVVDAIKTQTDKMPRILCHVDFWSLAKQITITSVAGDKGLIDVVVSGLPSNITIIAVQGMFMCDSVQNSATGVANYLESTKIQVHKKAAGTDRDAIVLEANKVLQFTTDMVRGGTVFVADWATATAAGILAEVATNTTYEMWFDVAEAVANNLVLDGAAFGLRIWFTI